MTRVLHDRALQVELARRDRAAPWDRVLRFRDEGELRGFLGQFLHDPSNRDSVRDFIIEQLPEPTGLVDLQDEALCDRLVQLIDAGVVQVLEPTVRPPLTFGGGGSGAAVATEAVATSGATGTPINAAGAAGIAIKMGGAAAGSAPGASGAPPVVAGAGPPPAAGQTAGAKSTACRLGTLKLMRSKGPYLGSHTAPYTLALVPGSQGSGTLQIVGGSTRRAAKVECEAQMAEGPCGPHRERVLLVPRDARLLKSSSNSMTIEVPAQAMQEIATDKWYRALWPMNVQPRSYVVKARSCQGEASARILCYPDIQWKMQIPIPVGPVQGEKTATQEHELQVSRATSQGILIEVTSDGQTRTLSQDYERYIARSVTFAQKTAEMLDQVLLWLKKITGGTLEWKFFWPNLNFTGEWGWKEVENKPIAGFEAEFGFKALPLFGVEGTYDVLDGLLQFVALEFPGSIAVVRVIQKARKQAKRGFDVRVGKVSGEISVPLTLSGMINGEVTGTKPAEAERIDAKGVIQGIAKARLEGQVSAELVTHCFFEIKVGAGVKLGGELTLLDVKLGVGSDDMGIYLDGSVKGFGGKISYAKWVENKISLESSSRKTVDHLQAQSGRSVGTKGEKETELVFWQSFELWKGRKPPAYVMKKT